MKRSKAGFTMAEVMLAVAIMAVLAAVAIPGVITMHKRLKMTELNDTAREIFLAAQNSLTSRKAAGTVQYLSTESGSVWLLSTDADMEQLLPVGTIEGVAAGNYYVIKYMPSAAAITEVYYMESAPTAELVNAIKAGNYSSDEVGRRSAKIGYYAGDDGGYGGAADVLTTPWLTVENDDDLTVTVTLDSDKMAYYLSKGLNLNLTVYVDELDADGNVVPGKQAKVIEQKNITGASYSAVLDSLTQKDAAGYRIAFKDRCATITPGANIRITATLEQDKSGNPRMQFISSSASRDTNSLFADRAVADGKDTAYIASARHLQNLEAGFSANYGVFSDQLYVKQTADIQWPEGVSYESIGTTPGYGQITEFDGNNLKIDGLTGTNGLFRYAWDCDMKNIRIVNPKIKATSTASGRQYGVLVGHMQGFSRRTKIENCQVYLSDYGENGKENYSNYQYYGIEANFQYSIVGGLVGMGESIDISNSFSSLYKLVSGWSGCGGLAGGLSSSTVTRCYASVEQMTGTPGYAGMLVGQSDSTKIDTCYAVGNIAVTSGSIDLGGFVGKCIRTNTGDIKNSYCAVTYTEKEPQRPFAAYGTDVDYLWTNGSGVIERYGQLMKWNGSGFAAVSAVQSHPYNEERSGTSYPFKGIDGLPHYGSWPKDPNPQPAIGAYDGVRGNRITELTIPRGSTGVFYVYAGYGAEADAVKYDNSN